jgi:predicted DNA-binding transcriptional regulator AlpA
MSSPLCDRLIPGREADSICGVSRSTRYELIRDGKFPQPVKIGWSTRFSYLECLAWVQERLAERGSRPVQTAAASKTVAA